MKSTTGETLRVPAGVSTGSCVMWPDWLLEEAARVGVDPDDRVKMQRLLWHYSVFAT